jgi:hypothetical protein
MKVLVSSLVLLRDDGNFKKWGLVGGLPVTGVVPLLGIMAP